MSTIGVAPGNHAEHDTLLHSDAHAAMLDALFGPGYVAPGGDEAILRLARRIVPTLAEDQPDQDLLLIGGGSGGPALALARTCRVRLTSFEAVPAFVRQAARRIAQAGLVDRASTAIWSAAAPALPPQSFDHALVLRPLGSSGPEAVLGAIGTALRPGGHMVLQEVVAALPFEADASMRSWTAAEGRPPDVPDAAVLTETMERLGFDVQAMEDVTDSYVAAGLAAWQRFLAAIRRRPGRGEAAVMVAEAERWLQGSELMRSGRLRLVCWHAVQDGARRIDIGGLKLEIMLAVQYRNWQSATTLWQQLRRIQGDTAETRTMRTFIRTGIRRDRAALAPEVRGF